MLRCSGNEPGGSEADGARSVGLGSATGVGEGGGGGGREGGGEGGGGTIIACKDM